jgi:hypothetical protein
VAKKIECHNGDLAWVDDDLWEGLHGFHWFSTKRGVFRKEPDTPHPRSVYLHREVLGVPSGVYVGFGDGDRLNCRRSNLYAFEPGKKAEALARFKRSA